MADSEGLPSELSEADLDTEFMALFGGNTDRPDGDAPAELFEFDVADLPSVPDHSVGSHARSFAPSQREMSMVSGGGASGSGGSSTGPADAGVGNPSADGDGPSRDLWFFTPDRIEVWSESVKVLLALDNMPRLKMLRSGAALCASSGRLLQP